MQVYKSQKKQGRKELSHMCFFLYCLMDSTARHNFSAAGPSNAAASPIAANSLDMPNLEDLTYFDDADDVGAEADINNLESIISNLYGTPRESLREAREATSARCSERPPQARRRFLQMIIHVLLVRKANNTEPLDHDDDIQKFVSPNIHSSSSGAQIRKQGDKTKNKDKGVSKMMRMLMEEKKEDDTGACIEKLDKVGWAAQNPMYDTALFLFGQSADYRKLWLHLKPESCRNWVKSVG
nr:L10-interacting MYB domain-containing protein-like [Tanacetum cinerariifolium]